MPNIQALAEQAPPPSTNQELQQLRQARGDRALITLVVGNSNLHPSYIEPFYEVLEEGGEQESLDLFLHTTGGQAEVPWALVCLLREFTDQLSVLVPFRAMSGGTHIALAGDDLVMGPLSRLGSVDPKRSHHLLPEKDTPHSVQDLKHCMEFIDRQWGEDENWLTRKITGEARSSQVGEIVTTLFGHVHPLAIGALEQSYELSRLITRKVLRGRRDFASDDPRIDKIEERLAGEYFSHGFFISRDEVEQELELPVTRPPDDVWGAMRSLDKAYRHRFPERAQIQRPQQPDLVLEYAAFIENSSTRRALARIYEGDSALTEEWVEV